MKNLSKILEIPTFQDERGFLTVMEDILPFQIKRVYWIYGADEQIRGGHRHKLTKQALVALAGTVDLKIKNGKKEIIHILDNPSKCIIVEPEDWHTMFFRKNSVLLVFASHEYDKNDYVEIEL
jgi:dTDP-4-dehydrorhamnose 3,5-epimerase-like enzyme